MQLTLPPLIGALRPHHWIKNLAIFILPLSGGLLIGNQFSAESLSNGIFYFFCLSLISSANYLINDVIDIKSDVHHPEKSKRAIAAGQVSPKGATMLAGLLFFFPFVVASQVGPLSAFFFLGFFGLTQLAYSLILKKLAGFDLVTLAGLYVIRAVFPATYESIRLSNWFLTLVFSMALFLACGKRFSEMRNSTGEETRAVLKNYSATQLYMWLSISLGVFFVSYLNWIFSFSSQPRFLAILLTLFPMTVFLIRVSFNALGAKGENPLQVIFRDPINISLGIICAILYLWGKGYL